MTLGGVAHRQVDPSVAWADLAWFRSLWQGPLVLKGVLTAADARRAVEHGVDGLIVSNHGGRQLDGTPASVDALPEIADAVGDRVEVLLDGGVRRGADVVRALALGARAVMVGRPYLYGLAAGGRRGCAARSRSSRPRSTTRSRSSACRGSGTSTGRSFAAPTIPDGRR